VLRGHRSTRKTLVTNPTELVPSAKDSPMRLPLLLLPLACLAGCMSDTDRAAPASPTPAKTPAPAATAPAAAAPAPVAKPAVTTPSPAPAVAAVKPAPSPVTLDLAKFTGPTENAELFGYDDGAGRIFLYSSGAIVLPLTVTADGDYELAINAACDEADGQKAKFTVTLDGQGLGGETTCTVVEAKEYTVKAPGLKAGEHKVAITFLNDLYKENEYDLNFYVHGVTLRPAK